MMDSASEHNTARTPTRVNMRGIALALELPVFTPVGRSGATPGMDILRRIHPTSTALPMTARSISACTALAAWAKG
jgi:hypothetical protein